MIQMKYLFALAAFASVSLAVAQSCAGLQVLGVAQDPFQADRIRLVCENVSLDEIYDYPGWRMLDADGNLLAEETVNYFGIFGVYIHDLQWLATSEVPVFAQEVTLQLWTGFYSEMACEFPYTWESRSFEWAGQMDGECLPVQLRLNGYTPPSATAEVTLSSLAWAGDIWSTTMTLDEAGGWMAISDSLCLSQNDCYTLEISYDGTAAVSVAWDDASIPWFSHAAWLIDSPGTTVTTWDLYNDDCVTSDVKEEPDRFNAGMPASHWPGGTYVLYNLQGQRVREWKRMQGEPFEAPQHRGIYLLVAPNGITHKWFIR